MIKIATFNRTDGTVIEVFNDGTGLFTYPDNASITGSTQVVDAATMVRILVANAAEAAGVNTLVLV